MINNFKNTVFLIALSIILISFFILCYNDTSQENIEGKQAVLERLSNIIHSIDINDTVYNDLSFLEDVLHHKKIVLLGELTHSDATTFKAKSRIVRYLHEKLGYNVVLYEAGLYDMWFMAAGDTLKPNLGLWHFWWDNDECRPLWNYFQKAKQSENPVLLGGFDIQTSGQIEIDVRKQLITNHLSVKDIDIDDYPSFKKLLNLFYANWIWTNKNMSQSLLDSIQTDLSQILIELKKTKDGIDDEVNYRYLSGIKVFNELRRNYETGDPIRLGVRDSLMADNLIWLVEEIFKEEKVIIWSANIHIFNDGAHLGFKPMGAYIKEKYGNDAYSIAFASYARQTKNGHLYDVSSNKSIEYLLHLNKNKYSFINLNNVERSFLDEDNISSVNQMINLKNNWKEQSDGIFFIDAIMPLNAK